MKFKLYNCKPESLGEVELNSIEDVKTLQKKHGGYRLIFESSGEILIGDGFVDTVSPEDVFDVNQLLKDMKVK